MGFSADRIIDSPCKPGQSAGLRTRFCRQRRRHAGLRARLHDPGQIGLPAVQDAGDSAEFVNSGLAALGIEADEVELAVIAATHQIFWPPILELLEYDTAGIEPEPRPDLSRGP
jgi:hypothetical protein